MKIELKALIPTRHEVRAVGTPLVQDAREVVAIINGPAGITGLGQGEVDPHHRQGGVAVRRCRNQSVLHGQKLAELENDFKLRFEVFFTYWKLGRSPRKSQIFRQ